MEGVRVFDGSSEEGHSDPGPEEGVRLRLYTGYDSRESQGWHAFVQSLIETGSDDYELMPPLFGKTDGTNAFTLARFEVFDRVHWGLPCCFVDGSDMLLKAPIQELFELFDSSKAIQVVKHSYTSKHQRKYVGTAMEAENKNYERKNWSSVMMINGAHRAHWKAREAILGAIARGDGQYLHRFSWLPDELIGELPIEWNWMPQEQGENENAKLLHFTIGGPFFKHYANDPMSKDWHEIARTIHSER